MSSLRWLEAETLIEAYWKSVLMPGQGLFIGEPLAAPFRARYASHARVVKHADLLHARSH